MTNNNDTKQAKTVKTVSTYAIIDMYTGFAITSYRSISPKGAIQHFRMHYRLEHNYPQVIAVVEKPGTVYFG